MKRGDLVIAAFPGEYGKPRPGVVVQSDATVVSHPTLSLCPVTTDTDTHDAIRIPIEPDSRNGLRQASRIMVDKVQPIRRERIRARIGSVDANTMRAIDTALRVWLGLA